MTFGTVLEDTTTFYYYYYYYFLVFHFFLPRRMPHVHLSYNNNNNNNYAIIRAYTSHSNTLGTKRTNSQDVRNVTETTTPPGGIVVVAGVVAVVVRFFFFVRVAEVRVVFSSKSNDISFSPIALAHRSHCSPSLNAAMTY